MYLVQSKRAFEIPENGNLIYSAFVRLLHRTDKKRDRMKVERNRMKNPK